MMEEVAEAEAVAMRHALEERAARAVDGEEAARYGDDQPGALRLGQLCV